MAVAGHGLGEGDASRGDPLLGRPGDLDEIEEAAGIGLRLVPDEIGGEPLDELVRRLRRGGAGEAGGLLDLGRERGPAASPPERGDVALHRNAVELDRPLDPRRAHRDRTVLHGDAEQHHVRRRGVPEETARQRGRVHEAIVTGPGDLTEAPGEGGEVGVRRRRMRHHRPRRCRCDRADDDGAGGVGTDPVGVARRDEEVEGEQAVDTRAVGMVRRRHADAAQAQVAHDRAGLLGEPGLVEAADGPAVEHRRGAEHLADGDHPGAADAGEADREVVGRDDRVRLGQPGRRVAGRQRGRGLRGAAPAVVLLDGDRGKRRAIALEARQIPVATRLVDAGLAPVRRIDRLDRQAVALVAAVAAPLADPLVDDDTEPRLGDDPPATSPPLLRRALLVVEEDGDARDRGELELALQQPGPVAHVDAALLRGRRSPRRATCRGRPT